MASRQWAAGGLKINAVGRFYPQRASAAQVASASEFQNTRKYRHRPNDLPLAKSASAKKPRGNSPTGETRCRNAFASRHRDGRSKTGPKHTHANTHTIGREKFRVRTCIMTWGFRKRVVSQGPRVVIWARFLAHSLRRGDVFPKRGFRLKNVQVAMLRMGDYFIWSWRCSAIAPRGDLFRRSIKYSFRLPTDLLESGAKLMRGYSRINDWHCPKEWRNLREAYFREVGTFMDLRRGWDS